MKRMYDEEELENLSSDVTPNPAETGTADLTKLKIGNTVYNIPSGGGSASNYNDLSNKPIINQNLDADSFTPVANTYYRHTGASSTNYVIGGIYYYNGTSYILLGGSSGGGTQLYKHSISVNNEVNYFVFTCTIISTNPTPFTVQAGQSATIDLSTYMTGYYPGLTLTRWESVQKGVGYVQALLHFEKLYNPSTGEFEVLILYAITDDGYQEVTVQASDASSTTLTDVVTQL